MNIFEENSFNACGNPYEKVTSVVLCFVNEARGVQISIGKMGLVFSRSEKSQELMLSWPMIA